jgi:hypothetical protein
VDEYFILLLFETFEWNTHKELLQLMYMNLAFAAFIDSQNLEID